MFASPYSAAEAAAAFFNNRYSPARKLNIRR